MVEKAEGAFALPFSSNQTSTQREVWEDRGAGIHLIVTAPPTTLPPPHLPSCRQQEGGSVCEGSSSRAGPSSFKFNFLKGHNKQQHYGDRAPLWRKILKATVLLVQMGRREGSRSGSSQHQCEEHTQTDNSVHSLLCNSSQARAQKTTASSMLFAFLLSLL